MLKCPAHLSPYPPLLRLASLGSKMDSMEHEEDIDEDDVAAGEALTGPLNDAFSGLQGMLTSTRISNQDFFVYDCYKIIKEAFSQLHVM